MRHLHGKLVDFQFDLVCCVNDAKGALKLLSSQGFVVKLISKPTPVDLALIGLTALIMASAFTAIKYSIVDIGPYWAATGRVAIGFAALLPFCITKGFAWPKDLRSWALIILIANLNMVIPFALIAWGLQHTQAGVAALLMGCAPFVAMVLSHFFTRDDRINLLKVFAVLFGLSGILLIVGADAILGLKTSALHAQLAIIAAACCYAISGILIRKVDVKPVSFTGLALGIGTACLIVLSLIVDGLPDKMPGQDGWIALLWLGLFPTGLGYILRFYLVQRVGVSVFSVGMNLVPVAGVFIAAAVLGEVVGPKTAGALGLVLIGLFLAQLGSRRIVVKNDASAISVGK